MNKLYLWSVIILIGFIGYGDCGGPATRTYKKLVQHIWWAHSAHSEVPQYIDNDIESKRSPNEASGDIGLISSTANIYLLLSAIAIIILLLMNLGCCVHHCCSNRAKPYKVIQNEKYCETDNDHDDLL